MEKKYIIDNKVLMEQWDYVKNQNDNIFPENITTGNSNIKIWWKCGKGHSYQQIARSKVKGIGCPICSNKQVLKGVNDLATTNPELLNEWNYEKNNSIGVYPYNVTKGSEKKVWWICPECKETYEAFLYSKKELVGCPYCSGKKFKKGVNDIFTLIPNWKKNWNFELNQKYGIDAYNIGRHSQIKAYWLCSECGKSFQRSLAKTNDIVLCNDCSKRIGNINKKNTILKNRGSLKQNYPFLMNEWDYEKNNKLGIEPDKVTSGSNVKVWWICPNGHSYKSTISHKISGRGCPKCSKEMSISFPEKAIVYYLKKVDNNILESYTPDCLKGKEIDIYIPSKKIGIEYDGKNWHNDPNRDMEKNKLCKKNNIMLYRIRESGCPKLDGYSIDIYYDSNNSYINLNEPIKKLIIDIYNTKIDVDIERDKIKIYELLIYTIKSNSLESVYPDIAREWDYKKNKPLTPNQFYCTSSRKVWWKCEKGHSYESTISHRTMDKNNCPYCSNQKLLIGYNDLATTHPYILKEWDYDLNNKNQVYPSNVFSGSHKKVWWKCEKGHEWEASIINRIRGRNCPICSNKIVVKGINDITTTHPIILDMWNYYKNEKLDIYPQDYSYGSSKKVWWICPKCKNQWQQRINHIISGIGCPNCHYNSIKSRKEVK